MNTRDWTIACFIGICVILIVLVHQGQGPFTRKMPEICDQQTTSAPEQIGTPQWPAPVHEAILQDGFDPHTVTKLPIDPEMWPSKWDITYKNGHNLDLTHDILRCGCRVIKYKDRCYCTVCEKNVAVTEVYERWLTPQQQYMEEYHPGYKGGSYYPHD